MKILFDLLPIVLFFAAYKFAGIYVATGVAITAAALQVAWMWWREHRVDTLLVATLGLIVLFGGLTIALHNPIFVMWKPTLVNWLFAATFLGSQWIGERPLAERMMGHAVTVPSPIWRGLNLAWAVFFFALGLVNLVVVYWATGFYQAQQALLLASGKDAIDLADCAVQFTGNLLAQCNDAHDREGYWVNFKLFGMMGLTILFVIAQAFYLGRHVKDEPQAAAETD
ncbi:inner membrane-spanning protein YciB [uncultured Thiodictyon sp.]|uniref:inner membrane-spanning protein YciB n=1 Tax=uncultured Thiodictyon sp. TaxID=1846217 RepID=UPI0025D3E417|nr:inner membrane-spanning protein YciB [uncultured Thiodictyon sp.]